VNIALAALAIAVTVTNASNVIDGDVSSMLALIARPGADGISLREAIAAANNTAGPKEIHFSGALAGQTILLGSNDPPEFEGLMLRSGDLLIDGDVDGDGKPDIKLDGTLLPFGTGIHIRAGNVTLNGLVIRSPISGAAIDFACPDPVCARRVISNVRITNNDIENFGVSCFEIGLWGFLGSDSAPLLSDHVWSDITVEGNTLRCSGETCLGIRPSVGGASRNSVRNYTIRNNRFFCAGEGHAGINVDTADSSSPPNFSDDSIAENIVVEQNTFSDCGPAIELLAGNWGNQRALLQHVRIANNTIATTSAHVSIRITAAQEPRSRSTSDNVMDDVVVAGNDISGGAVGIVMSGGGLTGMSTAPQILERNTLKNVVMTGNNIHNYTSTGLALWGGHKAVEDDTVTDNRAEVVIDGNTFEAKTGSSNAVGVEVTGGDDQGGTSRLVARNSVYVVFGANTFRGNATAISLIGGFGRGAQNNVVNVVWNGAQIFAGNARDAVVNENIFNATGNRVLMGRRRAARH
jgi:hypothetical protein